MGTGERHVPRLGSWRSKVPAWLRHGVVILLLLLIVEYLVIPELVGAKKDLHLLDQLNVGWLAAGIVLEAASLLSTPCSSVPCCSVRGPACPDCSGSCWPPPASLT